MSDYDTPWKEAMDHYFAWFLAFFFPVIHEDIDWKRDHESLDTELRELTPGAIQGKRLIDKLVKVFTKHDDEVLLHGEVQCNPETGFDRRLYTYNARVDSKHDAPVVSFVILGDDSETWRPTVYFFTRWGFKITVEFPTVKLLDYQGREAELAKEPNLFALLVLAHLLARQTREDLPARAEGKIGLLGRLLDRGLEEEDTRQWSRFLEWLLPLPEDLDHTVVEKLTRTRKGETMTYLTIWERVSMQKGFKKGLEEGQQEGRQEGQQEGRQEGLQRGIELALIGKLGSAGDELFVEVRKQHNPDWLDGFLQAIYLPGSNLESLRALLPKSEAPTSL